MANHLAYIGCNFGSNGQLISDYINFIDEKPKETRTAEEIANDVIEKCGLGG